MLSEVTYARTTTDISYNLPKRSLEKKTHNGASSASREMTSKSETSCSASREMTFCFRRYLSQEPEAGKLLSPQHEVGRCQLTPCGPREAAWDCAVRQVSSRSIQWALRCGSLTSLVPHLLAPFLPSPPFKFLSIWFLTMHRLRSDGADGNPRNRRRSRRGCSHSSRHPGTYRRPEPPLLAQPCRHTGWSGQPLGRYDYMKIVFLFQSGFEGPYPNLYYIGPLT